MATIWAKAQLACEVGAPLNRPPGLLQQSVRSMLIMRLDDVLCESFLPETSAVRTEAIVVAQPDVGRAFQDLVSLLLSAAQETTSETASKALAEYVISLASRPDATNETGITMTVTVYGRECIQIAPGAAIAWRGKRLWKDIPDLTFRIAEIFNGPELYNLTQQTWKNLNTWAAFLTQNPVAKQIPGVSGVYSLGLRTLVMGFEYSQGTRDDNERRWYILAAAEWMRIAKPQIKSLCMIGNMHMAPGDDWARVGGCHACDTARFEFWTRRLTEVEVMSSAVLR